MLGLGLLYGRYDWTDQPVRYAQRGFWLSAYLLAILLPTAYFGALRLLRDRWAARAICGVALLVATLPYEWLGLDRYSYYRDRPLWFELNQVPVPPHHEFFPSGSLHAFPYDWLFMPLLFAVGCGLIWGAWWIRRRTARATAIRPAVLLTVAFAVICTQAFLHSSMRAPYTYDPYFSAPLAAANWHVVYHFRDGTGATNADEFAFITLENYFQGVARDGDNQLIRRPFAFYLASQASYFVNTYYVWLGLNCLFWLAAALATARLTARIAGERAGLIAGALTVFGPGFVAFAATPAMYLQGYAAAAIALWAFEELLVRNRGPGALGSAVLLAGVLALCSLTYDLSPLLVALIAYGLARRVRPALLAVSIGGGFAATVLFGVLVTGALGIDVVPTNSQQISTAVSNTIDFLLTPSLPAWYTAAVTVPPNYLKLLLMAFMVVPLVVGALALPKLVERPLQVLVGALIGAYFLMNAVFFIGRPQFLLGSYPRLIYFVFPVVYLLAAMLLDPGGGRAVAPRRGAAVVRGVRRHAAWVVVALMAVLVNVDVFGYPTLYVEFFSGNAPSHLP